MKLRNKKTGEIVDFGYLQSDYVAPLVLTTYENDKPEMYSYSSLAELNEEWEDYEELKEYWFIDTCEGWEICRTEERFGLTDKENKEIGNYFETKEEAEKAVEKLKAWKRLKDKGYYFSGWKVDKLHFEVELRVKEYDFVTDEVKHDMNLLFGGEE